MISKETFCFVISKIREQEDVNEKFTEALNLVCDGHSIFIGGELYLESLLKLLKDTFNDEDEWIEWWLYEDVDHVCCNTDETEIPLETPEQLYDFLVDNYKLS